MTDEPKNFAADPTKPSYMPPVGQILNELDMKGAWNYMALLALEDRQTRDPFITIAELSVSVYKWGDVDFDGQGFTPPARLDQMRITQIENDTIAVTRATFREPTSFELVCSDTGSYAPCYWCGPASIPSQQPIADQTGKPVIDPMTGQPAMQQTDLLQQWGLTPQQIGQAPEADEYDRPTGGMSRQQPLDQLQAMQIEQQLEAGGYPTEWLCHADKRLVSSIYQAYFDGVWDDPKFGGDQWAYRFGLDANVQGWNTAMYEWRAGVGDTIRPLSIKQCYMDRQQSFIRDMQHVMADFVFDVTWAKQQFPWIAKEIDANKQRSGGVPVSVDGNTLWGQRDNVNWQRDIVVMRIGWFRDQPMPLQTQEAEDGGYVQRSELGSVGASGISDGNQADTEGTGLSGQQQSLPVDAGASPQSAIGTPTTSHQLSDGTPVQQPQPGQPVDPNWPQKVVLRRVMAIGGKIVSDMPEDHWDIPLLHLVCFPIPNTPFGSGVPFKCWQVQKSRTSIAASVQEHGQYYAHPICAGPSDVLEAMGADQDGIFVRPNMRVKINPEYLQNGRKIQDVFTLVNPLPLPPSMIQGEQMLEELQTSLSGNMPVLQGESPGASSSGRKVEALQSAALNQVNNAEDVECCLQRLAMLMQHAHVKFATVDDVFLHYRKLPRSVLEAIHVDIAPTLKWDIRVSTAGGGGLLRQRRKQEAMQQLETVDPYTQMPLIDLQTAREDSDIDHEEVMERMQALFKFRQQDLMVQQPQPGQPQPAGGRMGSNGNGNGNGNGAY